MHAIARLQPQGPMRAMEVVIEELQVHQRIEGGIAFGESVRLAGQGIEPITESSVESFDMHRSRWFHLGPKRGTDLHRQQSSPLITMLDRLRQTERLGDDQTGTPPFARVHPLERGRDGLLDPILTHGAGGAGDHEASVAVLDQAAPPFSFVRLLRCSLFFCTNDQNSSISTWLRCRSLASTCVLATAWLAVRLSHTLIVSYLCPVISSAARKLPRRITTNSAWATSAAGVFNPYIGVPSVSPK